MRSTEAVLRSQVRMPEHVVFRPFAKETVILNLNTGQYHGVNPVGGRILEVLEQHPNVAEAAAQLGREYGEPVHRVERELSTFCLGLAERGLVELVEPEGT